MIFVRAIWLPSVAMIAAFLALLLTGRNADAQLLTIICVAAFWAGYRISSINKNLVLVATAGAVLPIICVTFFGVAVWIETGRSHFDDLGNPTSIIYLSVALVSAAIFSILGRALNRKEKAK